MTGNNKREDKTYYRHTGYPGGIKERTMDKLLNGEHPERVIIKAVERMMSRGPLRSQVLSKLHVYAGTEHPHDAQKPEVLDLAAMNDKNKRSAK
jgi:large subunit ribosomal protein L13